MRILLDECVDRRLAKDIPQHDVKTVSQMGWSGVKNGHLLTLAEKEFDAFVTVDRNLSFQQNLSQYNIAVLVLKAQTNRLRDLQPLIPMLHELLPKAKRGEAFVIEI